MEDARRVLDVEVPPPEPGSGVQGDRIQVGNLQGTVAAIGRGASVTYHQALSAADQARAREDFEHEKLANEVAHLAGVYYRQLQQPPALAGSPYKYLFPFEFNDAWRFFGRSDISDQVLKAVICPDSRCRLTVLHGDTAIGKTSLLHAALAPALVAQGHLPLLVRATGEPLEQTIKRALIRDLDRLALLRDAPLREFLYQVGALLPPGKRVFVIMDQFEQFFEHPPARRQQFIQALGECLYAEVEGSRWLFCVRSNKVGYLSTFAPAVDQPLANSLVLSPLTAAEARDAILQPAALAGLQFEDQLVETMLEDLGRDAVDPSRLQLVCHTLVQSRPSGETQLRTEDYEKIGGAGRILQDHLAMAMARLEPVESRTAAWHALVCIAAHPEGVIPDAAARYLSDYNLTPDQSLQALQALENNRLIRSTGTGFHLAGAGLQGPIREWASRQAALEQARVETRRQLKRIRDSALRGLIGGGAGFALAYLVTFLNQFNDLRILPVIVLFEGLLGGIAGIIFIYALDLARVSFRGRLRWLRLPSASIAGAVAFTPAFLFHVLLQLPADVASVMRPIVQGVLWGLVAGVSVEALLMAKRRRRQIFIPLLLLNAAVLWVGEQFGRAYHRPRIPVGGQYLDLQVLLAGALLFAALAAAALWRNPGEDA